MRVVILAGGRGTRLRPLTDDLPKPLLPLAGKPILEYQIELARRNGLDEILILSGFRGDLIEQRLGDGARLGVRIEHVREARPLGTAGAVRAVGGRLDGDFLVFYGDVMMELDLAALIDHHRSRGAAATLAVHPNSHPYDSDLVETDEADRIVRFRAPPHPPDSTFPNLVSAALYAMSPALLERVPPDGTPDFGRDVFPAAVAAGVHLAAYRTAEYIVDVGTTDRLQRVERDLAAGSLARFNRRTPRPAVFLDRDGVLNREVDHVTAVDQLELLPGVAAAVRRLNRSGELVVVITNQPAIAKGFLDEDELARVHGRLEQMLGAEGAYVDRIYHCPHHPESGWPGERPELKVDCDCRKPGIGLIEQATRELNIDLGRSVVVGDREADVEAARAADLPAVLVESGDFSRGDPAGERAALVVPRLADAVDAILGGRLRRVPPARRAGEGG